MKKKIVFCAGGTGGHIFPAISLINYFKQENDVILVTDFRAKQYIDSLQCKIKILNISSLSQEKIISKFIAIIKLCISFFNSFYFLKKEKIDIVFGFGGYVTFPLLLAAKILNKKIYLYESNLVLGRTNKILLSFCDKIFTNTNKIINIPQKYKSKFFEVGSIIKEEIVKYRPINKKNENTKKTIIVLGGSQGAEIFGKIVPKAILNLHKKNFSFNIIQQALSNQTEKLRNLYANNNIQSHVFEFYKDIGELITKADLAISRSGASTTAELDFLNIPFIAIPYPFATDNHQYQNALYYKSKGSCWILEEKNLNEESLSTLLIEILSNNNNLEIKRKKMSNNHNINTLEIIKKEIKV
tara:strand:- start:536 stop:1603 length:1068 start_codon:yes stop_codon:yes gene_type:complete